MATQNKTYDILFSLYSDPCTFDELMKRDACKYTSEWGVESRLRILETAGLIRHCKNGRYFATAAAREQLAHRNYL